MNDLFLRACRGERVERIPVWFMRQAGRSLPGYRALRKAHGVLELTQTPELAAQVTREPVELLGVDAAVLFADIMLLPMGMGVEVRIVEGVGPVIDAPVDTLEKVAAMPPFSNDRVAFLGETIRILRGTLRVPLIGFSGAPFTLASYLIEGKPSRTWSKTKRFMLEHPEAWDMLMTKLSDAAIEYLRAQVAAGAQALQIFDSWVGCLSPAQYRAQVLPHMQRIFSALASTGVPRIHFGTNTAGILEDFSNVDCEVIGVDWRMDLSDAQTRIGTVGQAAGNDSGDGARRKSLQGNLDPAYLLAPWDALTKAVDATLAQVDAKQGYIFNLGHGMLPEADDAAVRKLVDYVHDK